MSLRPTRLEQPTPGELVIHWSDGRRRRYAARELRDRCPCATCRNERAQARPGQLPVLSGPAAPAVTIASMKPVGHYAYAIAFSDGHRGGIYTLEQLRSLGEPAD